MRDNLVLYRAVAVTAQHAGCAHQHKLHRLAHSQEQLFTWLLLLRAAVACKATVSFLHASIICSTGCYNDVLKLGRKCCAGGLDSLVQKRKRSMQDSVQHLRRLASEKSANLSQLKSREQLGGPQIPATRLRSSSLPCPALPCPALLFTALPCSALSCPAHSSPARLFCLALLCTALLRTALLTFRSAFLHVLTGSWCYSRMHADRRSLINAWSI